MGRLHDAARAGDTDAIRRALAEGDPVDECDDDGQAPLCAAAESGHLDALRALLEAGAWVRPGDVGRAAAGGHAEVGRLLLGAGRAQGVEPGPEALSRAVGSGSIELVRMLLDAGVDIDAAGEPDEPALLRACHQAPELMRLLLDCGADANLRARGWTALSRAVVFGAAEHVRLLLEHGAETEARANGVARGETPLFRVAGHGLAAFIGWHRDPEELATVQARDDAILRVLLEHGADVEGRDLEDGRTPLMHAAANGRGSAVLILIGAGARVDATDERDGRTALMWAAIRGQSSVVEILLEAGADPAAVDLDGRTAAELAHQAGFRDVAARLRPLEWPASRPRGPSPGELKQAAMAGDVEAIRAALRSGIEPEARLSGGTTALVVAARRGHARAVAALLEAGADPDAPDRQGETPLKAAIRARSVEAVRRLLRAGADPDAAGPPIGEERRPRPLFLALNGELDDDHRDDPQGSRDRDDAGDARAAIVRELIAAGASVDAPDERGVRPLWSAFDFGRDDLAELLAEAGAGREPVGAAYLWARELPERARGDWFRGTVRDLARLRDAEPEPIIGPLSHSDWLNLGPDGPFASGPRIGAEVIVSRTRAEALIAEHRDAFLRRGAFLFRSRSWGDGFDMMDQRIGLLPTDDPFVAIAAICRPGLEWGCESPGLHIRDLMAIGREHPFALIGCERHALGLESAAPIRHLPDLARRLLAIRTNLTAQGLPDEPELEEVVAALEASPRIGFCWH